MFVFDEWIFGFGSLAGFYRGCVNLMLLDMNEIFNINRFGFLIKKFYRENLRFHLLLVALMIVAIWLSLCSGNPFRIEYYYGTAYWMEHSSSAISSMQYGVFWFFLVVFSIYYSARAFRCYTDKGKAVTAFLLPASVFEKYLVVFFYSVIVFVGVYCLVFYAVDWCVLQYRIGYVIGERAGSGMAIFSLYDAMPVRFDGQEVLRADVVNVFKISSVNGSGVNFGRPMSCSLISWGVVLVLLSIQSLYMLGSIVFRKYSVLLTSLLQSIVSLGFLSICYRFFLCYSKSIPMDTVTVSSGGSFLNLYMSGSIFSPGVLLVFSMLFPISYFVAAFFKLKEKQF